jgi:hypothetical protein
VVKEIKGTFDSSNIPVLSFDPGMVSRPSREMLDEVVIDIKMFNGSVDVPGMRRESCITEKTYYVKESRAYPTQITGMPNMVGDKVIMDGGIHIHYFRNIAEATVVKDTFML